MKFVVDLSEASLIYLLKGELSFCITIKIQMQVYAELISTSLNTKEHFCTVNILFSDTAIFLGKNNHPSTTNICLFDFSFTFLKINSMHKLIVVFSVIIFTLGNLDAQPSKKPEDQIKRFWFVMLSKGTNLTHDSATTTKIQKEHIANIYKLYYDAS